MRHWWDITISATRSIIKLIHVTVDLFFHDDETGGLFAGWVGGQNCCSPCFPSRSVYTQTSRVIL